MDGMTIDEVIKYFDDDAKENAKLATIYRGNDDDLAEMHKQDANRSAYVSVWLRELKAYRSILANADKWIESEYGVVIIEGYKDVIDQMNEVYMEVNADGDCN